MSKILAVIRESTERQETESQKQELVDYCKSLGFAESDIEYLAVAGASARKLNKKYLQMLEDIKNTLLTKGIKNCAFWHLNRLGRVDTKIVEMKNWFIANGIQVYIKNPSLTLLDADGTVNAGAEIAWGVFATMVKQDTEELFQKWQRGKKRNAQNKKFNGGNKIHFGYKVNADNYIVPDFEEVKLVKLIYNEYITGKYSVYTLATELNKRGIRQRGKKINDVFLSTILSSTAYIGYTDSVSNRTDGTKVITHREYTPIIDKELYDKCAALRASKNVVGTATKESKHSKLCVKLIKCAECGSNFMNRGGRYVCYHHKMNKRFETKCSNSISIRDTVLDTVAWEVASILQLDLLQHPNNELIEKYKADKVILEQKQKETQNKINGLQDKKVRNNDLYFEGEITKKQWENNKGKLIAESISLGNEVMSYAEDIDKVEGIIVSLEHPSVDTMFTYADAIANEEDAKEMREIIFKHIKKITVEEVKIDGEKGTLINIETVRNGIWKYVYFFNRKRNKKTNELTKVYKIDDDGTVGEYPFEDDATYRAKKMEELEKMGLLRRKTPEQKFLEEIMNFEDKDNEQNQKSRRFKSCSICLQSNS